MKQSLLAFASYQLTTAEVCDIQGGLSIAILAPAPAGLSASLTDRINTLADRYNRLALEVAGLYQEKQIITIINGRTLTTIGFELTNPAKAARLSKRMELLASRYAGLLG